MLKVTYLRFVVILVTIYMVLLGAIPVFAGVRVSPVSMEGEVSIGRNKLPSISVTNTDTESVISVSAQVKGFGQNESGTTISIDNDTSPCTATSMISLSPEEFNLKPGETKKIDITAIVPSDATGGKYATIVIGQKPEAGTSILGQVAVTVVLSVSGTSQTNAGQIMNVGVIGNKSDGFLDFSTTVRNQGDIHIRPVGDITVSQKGQEIGKVTVEPHLILPGYDRSLKEQWETSNLAAGSYDFKVNLDIGGGNQITAEGSFTVDKSGNITKVEGGVGESGKVIVPPVNKTESPSGSKSVDWRLLGEIVGGILLIGIVVYLVASRRKK